MAKKLKQGTKADSIVTLLDGITVDHYNQLCTTITEVERRLDSLKAMRNVAAIRLGIEQPRKYGPKKKMATIANRNPVAGASGAPGVVGTSGIAPVTPAKPEVVHNNRDEVAQKKFESQRFEAAKYILKNGPYVTKGNIIGEVGVSPRWITDLLKFHWFVESDEGIRLTPAGKNAAAGASVH